MKRRLFGGALALGVALFLPSEGRTQAEETAPPAEVPEAEAAPSSETDVPPVEVVQPKPKPQPKPSPRPVVTAPPPPAPAPLEPELELPSEITEPLPAYYGPPGGRGNFERTMESAQSPIVPIQGIVPGDLSGFAASAQRVTRQQIDEQDPLTTNDILQRVPGVSIVNDDGLARHGGIGIEGSPARRSRKVLVLEDGRSINMSIWMDPSTHYVPPPDRIESMEVLKGTVVYGPNNNHGVVNFRNLQPFGPNETVVSGSGGWVALDGARVDESSAATWHVHTRRSVNANGNRWGTVFSYSGADAQGAWDTERLRYNDFYAALGWAGVKSDLTLSAVYFRQRDDYDEANFALEEEEENGDEDSVPLGLAEKEFFQDVKHCKTCFDIGSVFNTYNADVVLLQGVYNYYFDTDTTLSARVYGQHHRRDRYQNFEGENPAAADGDLAPVIGEFDDDGELVPAAFIPEGVMLGRLRTYEHVGTEIRSEFANRPFLFGLDQDIQIGARYEHHNFTNRNFFGRQGEILEDGDSRGLYVFDREMEADAFSAFLETSIAVTPTLNVVPGVRLDAYKIKRRTKVLSEEEGEGEDEVDCPQDEDEECVVIELDPAAPFNDEFDKLHVLPGIFFAWGFGAKDIPADIGSKSLFEPRRKPTYYTTVYGGYWRGLTMGVLREATFPPDDELGNNYQLGIRSTRIKGVTLDVSGFHKDIQNYQIKGATTDAAGNNVYSNLDEVEINGVEIYSRLDTRPFTGWSLNPFVEGSYTLQDSVIARGVSDQGVSLVGNFVPEVPREVAYLTAGIESTAGWNASVSWIYRGSFYTDEENTPYGGDPSGEEGEVPSVWLLAARVNYTIPNTDAVLYVSAENLTDELYIVDREDGIKPGLGRTVMIGARMKW
jgi:Fe(3+) dicitrate transport protein